MNATFRLPSDKLETEFANKSTPEGLVELTRHWSADGIRASIYNASPRKGVDALVSLMNEFELTHG